MHQVLHIPQIHTISCRLSTCRALKSSNLDLYNAVMLYAKVQLTYLSCILSHSNFCAGFAAKGHKFASETIDSLCCNSDNHVFLSQDLLFERYFRTTFAPAVVRLLLLYAQMRPRAFFTKLEVYLVSSLRIS